MSTQSSSSKKQIFFFNRPRSLAALLFFFALFFLGVFFTDFKSPDNKYAAALVLAFIFFYILRHFNRRIELSDKGVESINIIKRQRYFLPWSEIRCIGITKSYEDKPVLFEYLYFSNEKKDEYFDISRARHTPELLMIICRRAAVKCVLRHWKKKIVNYK